MSLVLLHTPANVTRWLLVNNGLTGNPETSPLPSWPAYSPQEPDQPDNVITVRSTEGTSSGRLQYTGEDTPRYGVQVRVRSRTEEAGILKAEAIRKWMLETAYQETVTLGSPAAVYTVQAFVMVGQVLGLGPMKPSSKLWLFTVNARVVLERAS